MKPLDAANRLQEAHDLLVRGSPLPLGLRYWLCNAFAAWPKSPGRSLDQLLSLVSRSGGKLHARSKLPARDHAIRALAEKIEGGQTAKARKLAEQFRAQRRGQIERPDIAKLRDCFGRLPESPPQLSRILASSTAASESLIRQTI